MEVVDPARDQIYSELDELLETAGFSFETVRMALGIGRCAREPMYGLNSRLASPDDEEREAGMVAVEALDHARASYLEMGHIMDQPEFEDIGLRLRFWSTFAWCWDHVFSDTGRSTGQGALRHVLIEAKSRTTAIQAELRGLGALRPPSVH